MRLLLVALTVSLFASTARAELVLCNRTAQPVFVAVAEDEVDEDEIVVHGWTAVDPGRCSKIADNFLYDYAFFAYQPASGRTWGDSRRGPRLCVRMDRNFKIRYRDPGADFERAEDFECPAGGVKRGFIVLANEFEEEVRFDLK